MKVYLAHAKANYASENDGYSKALRAVYFELTLYSFHFLEGRQTLPITQDESIPSRRRIAQLDEQRLGPVAPER